MTIKLEATLNLDGFEKLRKGLAPGQFVAVGVFGSHKNTRQQGGEITNTELAVLQEFGSEKVDTRRPGQTIITQGTKKKAIERELGSVTQRIPARSFIKMPLQFKRAEILKFAASKSISTFLMLGEQKKALTYMGLFCENIIQQAFDTGGFGKWAPNKPSTIKAKGSAKPLIDQAELRRAVWSKVNAT